MLSAFPGCASAFGMSDSSNARMSSSGSTATTRSEPIDQQSAQLASVGTEVENCRFSV
jgi:hypothetical protein